MSAPSRDGSAELARTRAGRTGDRDEPGDWLHALTCGGPEQDRALRQLHSLMLRAAGHQVSRMRSALPDGSPATVDVIVNQAADEAMTTLLRKLHTFEGRSRFTTWAYKFAILQVATDVRRLQWQHREVLLRDPDPETATGADDHGPEGLVEAGDLASAVALAMQTVLTPHQRRVAIALLVDGVPIDVLAERLGTTRGALYKTVHDARCRLRADLTSRGYLPPAARPQVRPSQTLAGTP